MLSVLDLARRIDGGELTPRDVVEMCAAAIAEHEQTIGAFAALDLDGARRAVEAPGVVARPLRGVPVGIKDIFDTVDFPTAYGSAIYRNYRPPADAAVVMMVRQAGGVILGKTVTTEFASAVPSATRNPRNPAHTPGGSSAGSAAAVAAGMLPLAIGSQTAGSVVRPASFCGVAGFKPSYRMLPTVGMKCFSWHLDTVGLFAATVADVAFAAAAITGRDLRVDNTAPARPRIGVLRSPSWPAAGAAMQGALDTAARAAQAHGATVADLKLPPLLEQAWHAQFVIQDYEAWRALGFEYERDRERINSPLRQQLDRAGTISNDDYDAARRTAARARRALEDIFERYDVILSPSAPGAAPEGFGFTGDPAFNRLWTLMGTPCINVPGLTDGHGLPLGVQITGRFGHDKEALLAARLVETAVARVPAAI
jgi:Asp-tRNA(Asn)/Glu-tRNA(Gln) amidotransferase A subunit family amidase